MRSVEVIPNLWLGDLSCALNAKFLCVHGIDTVINCTVRYPFCDSYDLLCYRVPVRDRGLECDFIAMCGYLCSVLPLINDLLSVGHRILIHCYAGSHRSVCIVLCYLMRYGELSLQESIDTLQSKWLYLGLNFVTSLVRYSQLLVATGSV